jgi:superfamily II DNA/RNA helicase
MQEIAEQKPYLWRNHRQAIAEGYLEPGTSAAISFPTGAGKSTLAELKVAATLLRGRKVVFLAPTLALVDQTARTLSGIFRNIEVQRERADELLLETDAGQALPAISVMTPERCLAMLSFDRAIFSDVGLLIFDECHLLHPHEMDRSRRAIDAMLCVLNFTAIAPNADLLLLSAMMMNCEEMAGWIKSLTGRPCLPLSLTWKPTRQVRGCVVYGEAEINELNERLRQGRDKVQNKHAPAALQRSLKAQPFGFFCLHQTWRSNERKDYALIPLIDEDVTLSTGTSGQRWYLTPNGNQVAAALAASTARKGLKTLMFTQTIPLANSASTALSQALGTSGTKLTESEQRLYAIAVDEIGGPQHLYLEVTAGADLISSSACHHGLLLPAERHLHESLFKRPDGIDVLVATSTLSQGMNLPSEVVIIGGDSRFDSNANRVERLEAHELLNAAGRAGRAGEGSYGFVLVVPSKVVHFNNEKSTIHKHWSELRTIFAQSDQCLVIEDPLTALLDHIHSAADAPSEMATYLVKRLPVGDAVSGGADGPARELLGRSFAAYRARARGDESWVQARIEAALLVRQARPEAASKFTWADHLAAAAAVPVSFVHDLGEALSGSIAPDAPVVAWRDWLVEWLSAAPQRVPQLIRRESLESLFGKTYRNLPDDHQRGQMAVSQVFGLLNKWMAGAPLLELEQTFGTRLNQVGKCESAREFVVRIVPELAYIFSVPAQVLRALRAARGEAPNVPVGLQILGACVKEGFDRAEKLALRRVRAGAGSRRAIHREFEGLEKYFRAPAPDEDFSSVIRRVGLVVDIADLL